MSKFQITFVFNKDTDEVTDVKVVPITKTKAPEVGAIVNSNDKIELKGSSLILTDDILRALLARVDSKLVLTVVNGKAFLGNPKWITSLKGGNKVTGKNTISCRGAAKDALEALGSTFKYSLRQKGEIQLIPSNETEDVLQITEETDDVISEDDIDALYNNDEEELADDINFDNI